jgi:phage shock protein A
VGLFDDSWDASFSSPSEFTLPPHLTFILLARAVRELLDEAQISDEAFAGLKAEALMSLAVLPQHRETKKLAKAITKLLARVEKALAKGNEALARRHLSNIADQLEARVA